MPPRKSDASRAATGDEETPSKDQVSPPVREGISIEDFNLPKSIVTRLAKGVLPPNTQVQGNAMLAMTKSATVFVNYLAAHANEQAQGAGRKTISDKDVLNALDELEFPEFRTRLEAELARFREIQDEKKNRGKASKAAGHVGGSDEVEAEDKGGESQGEDVRPAAKKARLNSNRVSDVVVGRSKGAHREKVVEDAGGEEEEEEEQGEDAESEDDEDEVEERLEVEEKDEEEPEEKEAEDEALDNGEDTD